LFVAKLAFLRIFNQNYATTFIMKQIYFGLFMFFVMALSASAFEGIGTIGGRSGGMGKASVALTDFWSIQNNPAGIATQRSFAAGIAYQSRFMMKELGLKSVAAVVPLNFGVIGVSFNQFGYNLYNENKLGIAYARSFGEKYRLGLQLDYLANHFAEGYENFNTVTFELGAQADVTESLSVGAYVFNLPRVKRSDLTDERLPVVMRFGLLYHFTPSFLGTVEVEKQLDFEPDVRFGMEYLLNERFVVRAGLSVNPGLFTFGTGLHLGDFRFDIAAGLHQVLGASVQAGLIYTLSKKTD
jgi:hypothetical protein